MSAFREGDRVRSRVTNARGKIVGFPAPGRVLVRWDPPYLSGPQNCPVENILKEN
jgi:hypothetical protein